ncbi:MAG: leucyl aminopeptidase, partial [Alphaproteobacteria bacterium]|nr:leucyl aminopeptidase [Alphaproteobacteria bacterium]
DNVVVVGVGKAKELIREDWVHFGISVGKRLDKLTFKDIAAYVGEDNDTACAFIEGFYLGAYRFEQFKSKPLPACSLKKLVLLAEAEVVKELKTSIPKTVALAEAQAQVRDFVNLPSNIANPEYLASEAKKLKKLGLSVEVLDEKKLAKLGMNLMMAVGKGAAEKDQPRLVIIKYTGAGKKEPYRALVGKGVMFDTGGYNVKPGKYMQGMKADMGGAAAVFGTMRAIVERKVPINVIGVLGCAMNMISRDAFIDDEVYTGYNGKTVEIGHTDAEGRMVLADAMAYTIDKYKPSEIIDLATLTGAILVALAGKYGGLFSNADALSEKLLASGKKTGEQLWRMPVDDDFLAKSDIADMNNDGKPYGGSSVAALFLKQFVGDTPWAHLDIAGMAMADKASMAKRFPSLEGGTGFGVRLLVDYLESEASK